MAMRAFALAGNELLSRVFHGSSEGLAVARLEDGAILEANDAFLGLLGRARESASSGPGLWADDATTARLLRARRRADELHVEGVGGVPVVLSVEAIEGEQVALVRARTPGSADGTGDAELRTEALRYRALLQQIPAITYTEVPDDSHESGFRVTFVSPHSTKVIGYTPEELLADTDLWYRRMPPEDRLRVLQEEARHSGGKEPFSMEYRMVARDGATVWFRDESVPVEDAETGIAFWHGVMLDITEEVTARQEVHKAEWKFQALVEALPAVVYIDALDVNATNLYTSPRSVEVFGYTPEEWTGDPDFWPSILHPDDGERVTEAQRRHVEDYEPLDIEYRLRTKDGRWVWVMDEAVVVHDEQDRPMYSQGFLYDVTRRKEAEQKLAAALEREREAADRLRDLGSLKDTILHAVSHDLRSPLAAILMLSSTLERANARLAAEDLTDLLRGIASRARKIDRVLADLLDLDRLDRGIAEPNRSEIELGALVRHVVEDCEPLEGRPVEVEVEGGEVTAQVDGPKIERILENLLVNAGRHTPAGSRVWARVVRREEGVLLVVEDEGPGIPDHLKEAIFEPYRMGDRAGQTHAAGSGIGLSLVARFTELHGGRAWVEDRPGGGASFRVLLPG